MYGYICMYNGHKVEVYTDKGAYAAQTIAQEQFAKMFPRRKVKGYQISVCLCEANGKQVEHKPDF